MPKNPHSVEQIIGKLREADVRLAQGESIGAVCRELEVSEQTYYRWRREYGGLKLDQVKAPGRVMNNRAWTLSLAALLVLAVSPVANAKSLLF